MTQVRLKPGVRLLSCAIPVTVWLVCVWRAWSQAITCDEGRLFLIFERRTWFETFSTYPEVGHHVLHTALVKACTALMGVHPFIVRLPSLLGAALFMRAAFRLSMRAGAISGSSVFAIAALLCFSFNPFILDFLVASRGYSLGLGLLMTALSIAVEIQDNKLAEARPVGVRLWCVSVFAWLAVGCNASFLYAAVALVAALTLHLFLRLGRPSLGSGHSWYWQNLLRLWLPGPLLLWLTCGAVLLQIRRDDCLGVNTITGMIGALWNASTFVLPQRKNINLLPVVASLGSVVGFVIAGVVLGQLLLSVISLAKGARREQPIPLTTIWLLGVLGLHMAAHIMTGMPYGLERTAIAVVPVVMAAFIEGVLYLASRYRTGPVITRLATILCVAVAGIFLLCFRTSYFAPWRYNSASSQSYEFVAQHHASVDSQDATVVCFEPSYHFETFAFYARMHNDARFVLSDDAAANTWTYLIADKGSPHSQEGDEIWHEDFSNVVIRYRGRRTPEQK